MKKDLSRADNRRARLRQLIGGRSVAQFVRDNAQNDTVLSEIHVRGLLNTEKSFGEKTAAKIERACGLASGYFDISYIDEEGLTRECIAQAAMAFGDKLFEPEPGYIAFGLLDVRASAGSGSAIVEHPEVVKHVHVLEAWAKANLPVDLSNIKVISARGTSMQGSIENGDVLFVDSSVKSYDGDGIYVIARGHDVQVKRLQKLNGDVLAVISDNRAYESERLTGADADSIVICGRVLAAWTIRKFW